MNPPLTNVTNVTRYCLSGSKDVVVLLEELASYLPRLPVRHLAGELMAPPWISPGRSGLRVQSSRNTGVSITRLTNANGGLYTRARRHTISSSSTPPNSPAKHHRLEDEAIDTGS